MGGWVLMFSTVHKFILVSTIPLYKKNYDQLAYHTLVLTKVSRSTIQVYIGSIYLTTSIYDVEPVKILYIFWC